MFSLLTIFLVPLKQLLTRLRKFKRYFLDEDECNINIPGFDEMERILLNSGFIRYKYIQFRNNKIKENDLRIYSKTIIMILIEWFLTMTVLFTFICDYHICTNFVVSIKNGRPILLSMEIILFLCTTYIKLIIVYMPFSPNGELGFPLQSFFAKKDFRCNP